MSIEKVKIGFVGCGDICRAYFKLCKKFPILEPVAVADIDAGRAAEAIAKHELAVDICTTDELIARDDIEIVVNITPPVAHAEINLAAIAAGKHVYTEKPFAATLDEGRKTLAAAEKAGVLVGCAPDTILGAGYQTCRKLIDDGAIGTPVAANAFMMGHGAEGWHKNPEFFYAPGGGPMLDMGPYYLTAMTMLLGPIAAVKSSAKILYTPREIAKGPKAGKKFDVTTPDHITGILDFASGVSGTIITSFATWASQAPRLEIHGTETSISCPDPNKFGGPVLLFNREKKEWDEVPLTHSYDKNSRSLGIADLALAIRTGEGNRACGAQGLHVLEVMQSLLTAAETNQTQAIESTFDRPAPMPQGLEEGQPD